MRKLDALALRADYGDRVVEIIMRLQKALDESEAVALLDEAAERLGVDAAVFVSFMRNDPFQETYRFLLACDPAWCSEYERRAWYADDPWLLYALDHSEPIRASEVNVSWPKQRAVVELAAQFGFRSALIVPAPSGGQLKRVGVLCLGSSEPDYFDGAGYAPLRILARSLAMELHEWWIDRIKRELIASACITQSDLILLRHERLGFPTKVISAVLGRSPQSVDSHFQRLNARLGVPSRSAAAQLAAECGLI